MEGLRKGVAASGHKFRANGDAAFDAATGYLVGDVLYGFEAGGAEAVDGASGGGVWEAGGERGGADYVSCFRFGDLL